MRIENIFGPSGRIPLVTEPEKYEQPPKKGYVPPQEPPAKYPIVNNPTTPPGQPRP